MVYKQIHSVYNLNSLRNNSLYCFTCQEANEKLRKQDLELEEQRRVTRQT